MRNLKRALSLTLASVMLLGMMVVGSSAAGFPDVEDTHNVEAIEVLQAVDVMVGDDKGNFGPDQQVSRAQMAVVMAKLLNLDYNYYQGQNPFKDVPNWAAPYVAACYANGIVSGYNSETYGANDNVTAVQAASMMMRALGYFQYKEDYNGGFELATVKQASEIGMFSQVNADAKTPLTRNQVAQMALNALQADMVRFTGTPGIEANGIVVGYKAEYTPRTSTDPKYNRLIDNKHSSNIDYSGQYYVQLGEELYNGDLTKKHVTDDFERPSYNWQFKGKEIGTYVDYTVLVNGGTFTEAVKYSELYELLTYTTIDENDIALFIDGVPQTVNKSWFARSNKTEVGGQGVLTEVFVDRDRELITITSINTYLAQANSDYNTTNETLSLNVYQSSSTGITKIVDSKDVAEAAGVAKDDYRLVYMSGKDSGSSASMDVVKMFNVDVMAQSSVTKWSISSTKVVDKLTTGGTEYKSNDKAYYDANNVFGAYNDQLLTDTSYNIYMDRYGNVIGVDLYEGTKNYVFITGYDRGTSHISVKTADAAAIFLDGTMDTITVNVTDTDKNITNAKTGANGAAYAEYKTWQSRAAGAVDHNRWYTYTQASNGNYTLKPVERFAFTSYAAPAAYGDTTRTLNSANLFLDDSGATNKGRFYGNDDSIYLTVSADRVDLSSTEVADETDPAGTGDIADVKDAIADVEGVYTGAQNVKIDLKPDVKQETNTSDACDTTKTAEKNAYVYSIFDKNYYIIASVVLGEAQGAATNYIYTLGGAKSERVEHGTDSRAATDDTYYWEVEAVVNGEKTTLTVKSKFQQTVDIINANVNKLVEVRYDGEYVTKIDPVNVSKIFTNQYSEAKIEDMKVYDVGGVAGVDWTLIDVADNIDNSGIVHNKSGNVINPSLNANDKNGVEGNNRRISGVIELVGRTLYTDRARGDVGLALAANAKAVLVQPENGKIESVNCGSVAEAVGRLADRNTNTAAKEFKGRVVAVLDSNGVAQWVVIVSDTNLKTGNNPNYGWNSTVDFGNIHIVLYNMTNKNVSGMIGADNKLYVTLPRVETLTRAKADTDKYDVSVSINGAEVGDAAWYSDTAATVTYVFDKVPVSYNGNMYIVVTVIPKDSGSSSTVIKGTITGGTVTVNPANPAAGATVTLTGTPTTPGQVPTFVVTDASGKAVTLTKVNDTEYTFVMPSGNVVVNATFAAPGAQTYTITIGTVTGGTVTASATSAAEGTEITLTATPTTEGQTATFTVTKASGGTVTVTNGKFTMPAENVTVTATFSGSVNPPVNSDLPKTTSDNASDPLATGATLTVAWYTDDSTKTQPTAAEIKAQIKKDLDADLIVNVSSASAGTAMSSDGTKTYTLALAQQRKVTLDDAFLAYIKDSDASAKVVMPNKTGKYIAGAKGSAALTVNASSGEYAIGSKTADTALYTAIELAAGSTLALTDVYVQETDAVQGTKYTAIGSDKFVKVGSSLRVVPKANTGVWSYLTKNGDPLANAVYNTAIANYDITVAATDVGENGKLTFDQVQGVKVYIGTTDTGKIVSAAATQSISIASTDFTLYQGKTFVQAKTDYKTAITPTFVSSGAGAWSFGSIDGTAGVNGIVYLVEAATVKATNATNMANTLTVKLTVNGVNLDKNDVAKDATLYLPIGAEVTLKTAFGALGAGDANVGKAIFAKLGATGTPAAIEGAKNKTTKDNTDLVEAEATITIEDKTEITISIDNAPAAE